LSEGFFCGGDYGILVVLQNLWEMTSPQGLDDLFWGCDYEDVTDWAKRLTMAAEVCDLTPDKLFKITKLNLRGRAKEWFRRLQPVPTNWTELWTLMIQKYGNIDADDIRMKMDVIKQEPKERVQKYFERLDKMFQKGQIQDVEQKRRFLAKLRPEIRKLCVVRVFADIEELVADAIKVERVLGELGGTPYELLKEEREEGNEEDTTGKQVVALNNTLINFFKGIGPALASASSSNVLGVAKSVKQEITKPPPIRGSMMHGQNAPSAVCHIGRRIVESSVPFAQAWGTWRIDVGGSPKMGRRILGRQTS
jgi:hypothetical protein